jgi:hypothetical protein
MKQMKTLKSVEEEKKKKTPRDSGSDKLYVILLLQLKCI